MESKKIGKYIILIAFIVVICGSRFIWLLVDKYVDDLNNENRYMAEKPQFSVNNYTTFASNYESYFEDHLQFRQLLIELNNVIDYFIFETSSNDSVIIGEEGWLFYIESLHDYQRINQYSQEELEAIRGKVMRTKKYFAEQGIEFVIFIGPNKNTIYGEYMPSKYYVSDESSRIEQLVEYLKETTDVNIIYPNEELNEAKEIHPELLYYLKLDTHWNYMGGYFGSIPLLESLKVSPVDFEDIEYTIVNEPDFIWGGYDEANMLGLARELNEDTNYILHGGALDYVRYQGDSRRNVDYYNGVIRTYSDIGDKRKVFLARDSFGEAITPYLGAAFSEVCSVKTADLYAGQIEMEKPDILVLEIVERSVTIDSFDYLTWYYER